MLHCESKKKFCKKIFFFEIWYIYLIPISVSSVPRSLDNDMHMKTSLLPAFLCHRMWQLEITQKILS